MNSPLNCVHTPSGGGGSDGGNMVARLATFYVHNIQSPIPTNVTSRDRARSTRQSPPKDIRTRLGARMHANVRDRVRARAPKQHRPCPMTMVEPVWLNIAQHANYLMWCLGVA